MDPWLTRVLRTFGSAFVLWVIVAVLSLAYTLTGGPARDILVDEMLTNLVIVLGFQVFIGNTGVLSFGHMAFVQISAYATAVTLIPIATRSKVLPDLPFGLANLDTNPLGSALFAVVMTTVIGALVGIAVSRARGLAPTMITLALLFVVDQLVKNWEELTRGAGGLSGIPQFSDSVPLYAAAFLALVVALWFQETRVGRFGIATREDELAAPALGIRITTTRYVAWTVSIALVAFGGTLRAQSLGTVNPKQFTLDAGIVVLAMLIVGGMRTMSGAVLGTVLITIGTEAFRQLGDPQRLDIERFPDLFLGVAMLAIMILRPGGLLGDHDVAGWLRRRTHHRPSRPVGADEVPDQREHTAADAPGAAVEVPSGDPVDAPAGDPVEVPAGDPIRAAVGDPPPRTAVLEASDVLVRFGGFIALDGARIRVGPGEIVGLIGPNGAGKTTLFNVITGMVELHEGHVRLGDTDLTGAEPWQVARAGLARTFQNLRLFKDLTVRENVALAALVARRHRAGHPPVDVDALLEDAGLQHWADRQAGTLDYGNQRRLELARAAALSPEFLLLDEPTSGMSDTESLAMVDHVRSTAARIRAGVLVIDHDLGFITRISDHIVVLNQGEVLAEGTPDEVRADPAVAEAYLGSQA